MKHLTAEQVSGYLEEELSTDQVVLIEVHLAECSDCRNEVTDVSHLLTNRHRFPRVSRTALGVMATAAAAILIATVVVDKPVTTSPGDIQRSGPMSVQPLAIDVSSPNLEQVDGTWTARLEWRSAAPDLSYLVTLTESSGRSIWTTVTTDTVVQIPDTIELDPGGVFFWIVDVALPSGESASSGVQSFVIQ